MFILVRSQRKVHWTVRLRRARLLFYQYRADQRLRRLSARARCILCRDTMSFHHPADVAGTLERVTTSLQGKASR